MIAIVGKINRGGRDSLGQALVPANHTEARGTSAWGLVIAGVLLFLATTFVCLLLLAAS